MDQVIRRCDHECVGSREVTCGDGIVGIIKCLEALTGCDIGNQEVWAAYPAVMPTGEAADCLRLTQKKVTIGGDPYLGITSKTGMWAERGTHGLKR